MWDRRKFLEFIYQIFTEHKTGDLENENCEDDMKVLYWRSYHFIET